MIHATLSHFRVRTQWLEWNKMIRIQTRLTTFCMFLCTTHAACHFSLLLSVPFFFFPFCSLFAAVCLRKLHTHFKMFTFDWECAHYTTCSVSRSLYPVSCLHCTERFPNLSSRLSPPSFSVSVAQNGVGVCSGALRGHCMAWCDKWKDLWTLFFCYAVSQRPRVPLQRLSKGCESYWHRFTLESRVTRVYMHM